MSWIPAFEIGVWNAWLFMIIYPLQWLASVIAPGHIAEKTDHPKDITDKIHTRKYKAASELTTICWIYASIYSIFVPFQTGTPWLYTGLAFFVIGLAILVSATIAVAGAEAGKPFTSGVYRFSRHPMYLSMIFVYLAVSVAAASWLFFLITIITYFLQRSQAMQEESYCLKKFGTAYQNYMDSTPRWIGLPKTR